MQHETATVMWSQSLEAATWQALVSSAVQMTYVFETSSARELRHLCSLSRLEEATLSLLDHSPRDDAGHAGWEASGGLQALRRLSIRCVYIIAACPPG